MIEKKIGHIAYQLRQNKENHQPGAIVFVGSGCSVSAGIPTADKVVEYVLDNYKDNPDIKCLPPKPSYADLMQCLGPVQRRKIFKYYVEKAKINVSHIYLAHILVNDYVDYVLTVNFDNLAQRALALYNIFPPTYDISILKDLTTTTLDIKSITYLHGQYNGLWQLNTKEEMNKVIDSNIANSIFNKITNNRLWIIIGYSGEDFIFDQLARLGRFDNGLYWVCYKNNDPIKRVQEDLLNKPNTESFLIKGFDSDSFFLKLNAELKNEDPKIFSIPFHFLSELQENIRDIDDDEVYKSVKERLIESKRMVQDAINRYETKSTEPPMSDEEIENTQLKKALIDCLTSGKYEDLAGLENQTKVKESKDLRQIVSDIYYNWGTYLGNLAQIKSGDESLYKQAFEKFSKAIEIKPDYNDAYYNWGTYLGNLAKIKSDDEDIAESLYKQAFEKFSKAIEIKPDDNLAYYNWGTALGNLAQIKSDDEDIAESLYKQAFEKFSKAIEIKPDDNEVYCNWGTDLGNLAKIKSHDKDIAESLYKQAFEKFSKAIEIKPDDNKAYCNWGTALGNLAQIKSGDEAESFFKQAFEKFDKAVDLGSSYYNFACIKAISKNIKEAFRLLEICLQKEEITFKFVEKDSDWNNLREETEYKRLKQLYLK